MLKWYEDRTNHRQGNPPVASLEEPVAVLRLGVRASNCLRTARIHTIGDLVALREDDLKRIHSLGEGTLREIVDALAEQGLRLGGDAVAAGVQFDATTGTQPDGTDGTILSDDVRVLNLGVRASNCLQSIGVQTVQELVRLSAHDLANTRNLGTRTLDEIDERLKEYDLSLGMETRSILEWYEDRANHRQGNPPVASLEEPVAVLHLGVRASNCLRTARIHTIGDLVTWREDDLKGIRSLGVGTLQEIIDALAKHGLRLGTDAAERGARIPLPTVGLKVDTTDGTTVSDDVGVLNLGVRAANCLQSIGVRTVQDLVKLSAHDLANTRNLGKRTLEEINERLKEHDLSLRMAYPGGGVRSECWTGAKVLSSIFLRTLREGLDTADEELKYVVSKVVSPRHRNVVILRLGWSGQPVSTLEELAANPELSRLGRPVTKERVRQIDSKARQAIRKGLGGLCPRRCSDALRLVSESTPIMANDVPALLREHGLSRIGLCYSALRMIAELTGTAWKLVPLTIAPNPVLVSTEERTDYAAALHLLVSARSKPFARVSETTEATSQPSKMAMLLTRLVEVHSEYRWLDRDAGLFWSAEPDSNKIIFQCKKLFSLAERLLVDEIHTAVERTRTVTEMPPKQALIEMLRQTDWFEIHKNYVQLRDGISFDALSMQDRRLVRAAKGIGQMVRWSEIRDNLVREGVSSVHAARHLIFSPFLFPLERGRYRLLFDADVATANAMRAAEDSCPRAADVAHEDSWHETEWSTVVRISRRGMITDRIPIDADVPGGHWDVFDGSGHVGHCTTGAGVVRKLAVALRHGGAKVGDYCRLRFDFDSRCVEIKIVAGDQRCGST